MTKDLVLCTETWGTVRDLSEKKIGPIFIFSTYLKGADLNLWLMCGMYVSIAKHHRFLRVAWPHLLWRENFRVGGELER